MLQRINKYSLNFICQNGRSSVPQNGCYFISDFQEREKRLVADAANKGKNTKILQSYIKLSFLCLGIYYFSKINGDKKTCPFQRNKDIYFFLLDNVSGFMIIMLYEQI